MPVYIPNHNAVFIHIPKTGGTTVSKFLFDQYGKHIQTINGAKPGHIPTRFVEKDLFKFAFVRNPISWWESVYKMLGSMSKEDFWRSGFQPLGIVAPLYDKDFDKFMSNVIKFIPGFYSEMLTWYLGRGLDGLDFIGRNQYLIADLKRVLDKIGCDYNSKRLDSFPKYGARPKKIVWDRKIQDKIVILEKKYYDKFR